MRVSPDCRRTSLPAVSADFPSPDQWSLQPGHLTHNPSAPPLLYSIQNGLPPTLASLSLRLGSPHLALEAPPGPPLSALVSLQLSNYSGRTTAHARALMSGLPALEHLSLSWPEPCPAQPPGPSTALGISVSGGGGRGDIPFPGDKSERDRGFWSEVARLCPLLKTLSVDVDALSLPGVWDIPSHLQCLVGLGIRLKRRAQLPRDFLDLVACMPHLRRLNIEGLEVSMNVYGMYSGNVQWRGDLIKIEAAFLTFVLQFAVQFAVQTVPQTVSLSQRISPLPCIFPRWMNRHHLEASRQNPGLPEPRPTLNRCSFHTAPPQPLRPCSRLCC